MTTRDELHRQARAWLADDPDKSDRADLKVVLDALPESADELADRFAGPLRFGTAGLRGSLRAGPNGMNLAVVLGAAAGLVRWLATGGGGGPGSIAGAAPAPALEGRGGPARVTPTGPGESRGPPPA